MRPCQRGFTLIEILLVVVVISLCLLSLVRLMKGSNESLTQSIVSLNAQSSADDLLQQIKLMKWDAAAVPGQKTSLAMASVTNTANPRTAIEHWNGYTDIDNDRGSYGPFQRSVIVDFVTIDGNDVVVPSGTATDRKRVRIQVNKQGSPTSMTITSVFHNRP